MKVYDPSLLGLQVARVMGDELQVFCPYHFDNHPSASYNMMKGLFYCFGCHESKTSKQLANELGGSLVPMRSIPDEYISRPGDDLDWVSLTKARVASEENEYLKDRLVQPWQILKHNIRENSDGILFPMRDRFGKIRGMQIRHYKRKPKYKFYGERTPIWPMLELTNAKGRANRNIYLTEGIFGALRIELLMGAGQAYAIMGSSSIERVAKIVKMLSFVTPYALMDSDRAGLIAAGKFALHGINVLLPPRNWPDSPDEYEYGYKRADALRDLTPTTSVMDVIERSDNPEQIQRILEKYWRKM
jgi:DNA primase